jgi:hypothetical protein
MRKSLLDTGFLFAVLDFDDQLHASCVAALAKESYPIMPNVVLCELAYLVLRDLGYPVLINFLKSIQRGELTMEQITMDDLARAAELLEKYADSRIDFVDCIITAMAERLKIRRILTVDRRDFQLLRPKHCSYFEIVP